MSKREKIIIALMLLSVIYGAYSLFFESAVKKTKSPISKKSPAALDGFVAEIAQNLVGKGQSDTGEYVLARAEAGWEKDPFLESELNLTVADEADAVDPAVIESMFIYSGYLKMGKRGMAIINDMEYEVGEELENLGYLVKKITPTQVVLGIADSKKEFVLLLNESE